MHYGINLGTPSPFPLAAARETGSKIRPHNNPTVQFDTIPDPCHAQSKNGLIQSCVLLVT